MLQDFGYALRTLRKTPGFTAVAVLSLALGIGANSAIFSLANGLIFRPMHVPNASQVIVVQSQMRGESLGGLLQYTPVSYPDFLDLRNRSQSLADTEVGARSSSDPLDLTLLVGLLSLSGVVLLIACANVMNLMLSRGRARSREIAVRMAIGAGRGRLIRQFLTESLIIAFAGAILGLLVAQAGADLFSQIRVPSDIPLVLNFDLDPRVLLFTALVAVVSAVLSGLAPAFRSSRPDLSTALKPGSADGGKRRILFGRNALVVGQVTASLLLLVLATQSYRGVQYLLSAPPGFRTDHLLTAAFDPSLARYTPEQTAEFYKHLLERASTLGGVRTAALAEAVPYIPGGKQDRVVPEGYRLPAGTEALSVITDTVSEDYFSSVGIPIVEGRSFGTADRADAPRVAIVNQLFASRYYPNQSAVGRHFRLEGPAGPVVQIVGVAKQSKYLFPIEPPIDYIYLPLGQNAKTGMTLLLQTADAPGTLAGPLRDLVRSLDAGQPVIGIRTMADIFDQRARGTLGILIQTIGAMGLLGLVLALVGLYGLMTYSVGRRQREIGIRMAIGADRTGVLSMVLKQGLVLAGTGVAIGLAVLILLNKPVMRLVGAKSFDWGLLALTAAGLLGAAAVGAYLPARRASLVDPNLVLRQE
jgi:predicted permease